MFNVNKSQKTLKRHNKKYFEKNDLFESALDYETPVKKIKIDDDEDTSSTISGFSDDRLSDAELSSSGSRFCSESEQNVHENPCDHYEDLFGDLFDNLDYMNISENNFLDDFSGEVVDSNVFYTMNLINQCNLEDFLEDDDDVLPFHNLEKAEQQNLDSFLDQFLRIMVTARAPFSLFDKILKLINEKFCKKVPISHKTLINRVLKKHANWDYYIRCPNCSFIFSFPRKQSKDVVCTKCNCRIDFKKYCESNDPTISFSLKDQIVQISENFKGLIDLPENVLQEYLSKTAFSFDGVPVSDSSKAQLYPLHCFLLNIIDGRIRDKLNCLKTITLVKNRKIDYELCLRPFIDELKALKLGFKTEWSNCTKLKIECFIADAVCRAGILNMLSHNGEFCCHKCLVQVPKISNLTNNRTDNPTNNPTNNLTNSQKPEKPTIPLLKSHEIVKRTLNYHKDQVAIVEDKKQIDPKVVHYEGIKGPTILQEIEEIDGFNYIDGTLIEFMHCVPLGIFKNFLKGFMKDVDTLYYLDPDKKIKVTERISSLKIPSSVIRKIRTLDELADFKSSELQFFLFFYSPFVFKDILPEKIFNHLMLLSAAAFKLYSRHSSSNDVEDAIKHIDDFLGDSFEYCKYKKHFKVYNSHIVVHMPDDRKKYGPIANINAYGYENLLQLIKKDSQSPNIRVESFAQKALLRVLLNINSIDEPVEGILKAKNIISVSQVAQNFKNFILNKLEIVSLSSLVFFKEAKNSYRFTSVLYSPNQNDSFVRIKEDYFVILIFFKHKNESFSLVKKIKILENKKYTFRTIDFRLNQIKVLDDSFKIDKTSLENDFDCNDMFIFKLDELRSHCMYVELEERINSLQNTKRLNKYLVNLEH